MRTVNHSKDRVLRAVDSFDLSYRWGPTAYVDIRPRTAIGSAQAAKNLEASSKTGRHPWTEAMEGVDS